MDRITFSARSSSASFPVPSTLTRAPKILILSVSMANETKLRERTNRRRASDLQVFAMRILTFSSRFGEFTAIVLSRMKPKEKKSRKNAILQRKWI